MLREDIHFIYIVRELDKHLDLQMSSRNTKNEDCKKLMFILKVESRDQKEQLNYIYICNIAWQCNVYKTIFLNNLAPSYLSGSQSWLQFYTL